MSATGRQQGDAAATGEQAQAPGAETVAAAAPDADAGDSPNGVVEIDERRNKMERLRGEGVDPYPPVTLWGKRTRIVEILS